MPTILQVVVLDKRDYIIEHKDFKFKDRDNMNTYIGLALNQSDTFKIEIRKYERSE